jgi:hypothetical protein
MEKITLLFSTKASIILCVIFAFMYAVISSFTRKPSVGDVLIVAIQPIALINNTILLIKAIEGFECNITQMDTTFIVIGIIAVYCLSVAELFNKIKPLFIRNES